MSRIHTAANERPDALDEPLRVLHVVSHLPPDRVGGVGEVAATIHRGLVELGHESRVLTTGSSQDDPTISRVCATPDGFLWSTFRQLDLARGMDIVHFHHGEALGLMKRISRLEPRPRIVLTLHVDAHTISRANVAADGLRTRTGVLQSRVRDPLKHLLDVRAVPLADRVTFISKAGADEMSRAPEPATVIYNGVDTPAVTEPAEPTDLLFVGAPGPRKGLDLLPAMLREVHRDAPDTRLRIVGFSRHDEPSLVDAFSRQGCLDAVEWVGKLRSEQIASHYRSAKLLVVPSRYEGLPMVVLEAGAVGLPAVATDVGGTREAVRHGQTGLLVEPASIALAAGCQELLADELKRKRLGQAMKRLVETQFSVRRQVSSYVNLYRSIAAGGPQGIEDPADPLPSDGASLGRQE